VSSFLTKPQQSQPQEYQSPSYNSPHRSTDRHRLRPAPAAWPVVACLRSTILQQSALDFFLIILSISLLSSLNHVPATMNFIEIDSGLTFILVWKSGAASILAVICVRTKPGEMLLTRMPWGAHSMARVWVMLRRAALVPPLLRKVLVNGFSWCAECVQVSPETWKGFLEPSRRRWRSWENILRVKTLATSSHHQHYRSLKEKLT
jgi:hypothetical protein